MAGNLAELGIAFHIDRLPETPCHIREIHAEASRKVNEGPLQAFPRRGGILYFSFYHFRLVFRRQLARTLLHGEMGRINQTLRSGPLRQLASCRLPSADLIKRPCEVHIFSAGTFQRQLTNVSFTVLPYKVYRSLILHRLQRYEIISTISVSPSKKGINRRFTCIIPAFCIYLQR